MTPDRWARLQRLFTEALRCDPAERAEWLAAQTRSDPTLLAEVLALLDCDAKPDRAFERAIADEAAQMLAEYHATFDARGARRTVRKARRS